MVALFQQKRTHRKSKETAASFTGIESVKFRLSVDNHKLIAFIPGNYITDIELKNIAQSFSFSHIKPEGKYTIVVEILMEEPA